MPFENALVGRIIMSSLTADNRLFVQHNLFLFKYTDNLTPMSDVCLNATMFIRCVISILRWCMHELLAKEASEAVTFQKTKQIF